MTRKLSSGAKAANPRVQRYQDRADYLRGMARQANDADVRAELQRMAKEYDTLAVQAGKLSSP